VLRTTVTTGLGAAVGATAEQEQEPLAATHVLRAADATGLGAVTAEQKQEPIAAAVVLVAAALEDMTTDMAIEPTNRGLGEATKGLEEEDEHEEEDTIINLIDEEAMAINILCLLDKSNDEMSDDDVDILEDLYN
jgi:hypothetical protein